MSQPDTQSLEPKYGRRFIANAFLLAVVWTLAWVWFNAHVKPHISVALFSGVSFATLGVFCYGAFRSFVNTGAAQNVIREWLRSARMTPALLALIPLLAAAYLTTFTVYLNAGQKFDEVRLKVRRSSSTTPREVALGGAVKQRALSYYFSFSPVTLHVDTQVPSGYRICEVPLRRGFPIQLTVPDASLVKPFYLVRFVPLNDLFQLRGRDDPDKRYTLRLFVNDRKPIVHPGLAFRAIYLGASLTDLKLQAKSAQTVIAGLRNRLRDVDPDMRQEDIDRILADWLDEPEFIATQELKPGDKVRAQVDGPAGTTETTVKVSASLNDGFLKGEPE
jgi:hypothetical protein